MLNVTIPVFNEETRLDGNVRRLVSSLESHYSSRNELVIADNGSTDHVVLHPE